MIHYQRCLCEISFQLRNLILMEISAAGFDHMNRDNDHTPRRKLLWDFQSMTTDVQQRLLIAQIRSIERFREIETNVDLPSKHQVCFFLHSRPQSILNMFRSTQTIGRAAIRHAQTSRRGYANAAGGGGGGSEFRALHMRL